MSEHEYSIVEFIKAGPYHKDSPEYGLIINDAVYAYYYAKYILNGKFPDGEDILSIDCEWAFMYASYITGERFELGEPVISTDAWASYKYASNVLKNRFKLGERSILTSSYRDEYIERYDITDEELVSLRLAGIG